MNLEEVKQFLNENKDDKEVQAYLGELKQPTAQDVEGFLDTEEGKKLLQPRLDRNFTQGLNTWKENNLNKLIEDEVAKRNPEETPEQKRIRELEEKIAQTEKEAQRDKLMNTAVSQASEKGLPTDIVSFFVGEDEETTIQNLETFKDKYDAAIQSQIDAKFKENGRDVPDGSNDKGSAGAQFAKGANQQPATPQTNIWE